MRGPTVGARRFRFAPTPSRPLHVGSALAALLGWATARLAGGTFILRIEDIDSARCRPEHTAGLLRDLGWLGLDWDEGPDIGGPAGPYLQSGRLADYDTALARLRLAGLIYPCGCSRADIEAARSAPHLDPRAADAERPYPGTCRGTVGLASTPPSGALDALSTGPHAPLTRGRGGWRLAVDRAPGGPVRRWHDTWLGPHEEDLRATCGDLLLGREGQPTYQLAVVVDDHAMGVTDVVRGRDLLGSTARQLALHAALGHLEAPRYGHHPLIVDAAGRKLSKRDEAAPLAVLREAGVAPERVVAAAGRAICLFSEGVRAARPADVVAALDEVCRADRAPPRADGLWPGLSDT